MERVLFVLRGPIGLESLRRCCGAALVETNEMAICHVLPDGHDGVADALRAQRAITALLRLACGGRAEAIPVFVVTDREGDSIADCAAAWGATEIQP